MKLSSETKDLLRRSRRLLSRSWVSGHLFRRNPETNKPEYCLMGGILRSAGVKPAQMEAPEWDIFGNVVQNPKSKVQKVVEWSQYPDEAKVAMKALAVTILKEDDNLYYDYPGRCSDSPTAEEYIDQYPEETPNIIAEYNDSSERSLADIKRILGLAVEGE